MIVELTSRWPFVKRHVCHIAVTPPQRYTLPLVRLDDGRLGVIDHYKADGHFGVRPVDAQGNFYPNTSLHWTPEQRRAVPEEVSLTHAQLVPLLLHRYPDWARLRDSTP